MCEAPLASCLTGSIPANVSIPMKKQIRSHLPQYLAWDDTLLYQKKENTRAKVQLWQKGGYDKKMYYTMSFYIGDQVALQVEKHCKRKGKFKACYADSYMKYHGDPQPRHNHAIKQYYVSLPAMRQPRLK